MPNIKSSPQKINELLEKHQIVGWTYKKLSAYRSKYRDVAGVDLTLLAILLTKVSWFKVFFFNHRMFSTILKDISTASYNESLLKAILEKYGLLDYEKEFAFSCKIFLNIYDEALFNEHRLKPSFPRKKELHKIQSILKEGITQIIFKAGKGRSAKITDFTIIHYLCTYVDNLGNHPDFHLGDKESKNFGTRGRPKSYKTQALKTIAILIYNYLDVRNKLMPEEGVKISDKRRWFIAEMLKSLGMIINHEYNEKEYIESLLRH